MHHQGSEPWLYAFRESWRLLASLTATLASSMFAPMVPRVLLKSSGYVIRSVWLVWTAILTAAVKSCSSSYSPPLLMPHSTVRSPRSLACEMRTQQTTSPSPITAATIFPTSSLRALPETATMSLG
eukprot:CAMPEP_0174921756 /NCGR_PEP_ID=MMETSP1355-20121228/5386_1 /TAXON_ID=464990 /ORGANISM="Hemiselmis tepida, Strain CCMP443" /LENGTH=125 /DNA_ID=CAMNT_0016167281 /DNA_START=87 /DNA_END=460 /DNA_ORIENTATION=+